MNMTKSRVRILTLAMIGILIQGGGDAVSVAQAADTAPSILKIDAAGDGTKWQFIYSQFGVQSNQLQMPANQKVELNISTTATSDSLWIPQLGIKIDANPFQDVSKQISVGKPRKFSIMSVNLCNAHNKHMVLGNGNVTTTSSFESWIKSQGGRLA